VKRRDLSVEVGIILKYIRCGGLDWVQPTEDFPVPCGRCVCVQEVSDSVCSKKKFSKICSYILMASVV
jgi:hypothetical protein